MSDDALQSAGPHLTEHSTAGLQLTPLMYSHYASPVPYTSTEKVLRYVSIQKKCYTAFGKKQYLFFVIFVGMPCCCSTALSAVTVLESRQELFFLNISAHNMT